MLGIAAGRDAAVRLLASVSAPANTLMVLLDFHGMELVTASAARESIFKLATHLAEQGTLLVCVNADEATLDELAFAATALRQPMVVGTHGKAGGLQAPRVIGQLDAVQTKTLKLVGRLGEVDAKTASQEAGDNSAGTTGWNNRLSGMASLRLLKERKVGKTKLYSLTVEGLASGN
ncbi:hypothetical protein [Hydrogenophaga sp. PBC]|uniref:hypothetical protein n=1 Tax=Hydrogenophaga sp. PBC TaxID=795665 RepID=UPI0011DFD0CF|nr:hypothetical protein [Hydrogenophaga sp. PBC]